MTIGAIVGLAMVGSDPSHKEIMLIQMRALARRGH